MTMRDECTYLVGIDIGGTKCAVSLGEYRESDACPVSLTDKIRFDTNNKAGHADVIRRILDAVRELLARRGLEPAQIAAAGISCGGPLDSEAGLILSPPNLIGWDRVPSGRRGSAPTCRTTRTPAPLPNGSSARRAVRKTPCFSPLAPASARA